MKRTFSAILAVLMIAAALGGCGGSTASTDAAAPLDRLYSANTMEIPAEAAEVDLDYDYEMMAEEAAASIAAGGTVDFERKLIRTVDLSLESRDFDTALAQLTQMVGDLGGYIESSYTSGRSLSYAGDYYRRSAELVARIPAEKLSEATDTIEQLCNVTSRSESVNDISDSYYDVEGRLKTLRVEEERLLALLEQAAQLEDMLTIESHLSEVRYQIESLTGQLNRYDSQVNYSTVNMYLEEVVEYTARQPEPTSFGDRVGEAFADSIAFIGRFAQGAVLVLVSVLPFLLVYGGAVLVVVLLVLKLVRTLRRKKREKAEAAQSQNNDKEQQ